MVTATIICGTGCLCYLFQETTHVLRNKNHRVTSCLLYFLESISQDRMNFRQEKIQKIKKENVLGESSIYCIVCTVMVYQLVMQERTNVLVVQLFKDWKIEKKKRLGCQFILLVFTIYNGLPVTMTLN